MVNKLIDKNEANQLEFTNPKNSVHRQEQNLYGNGPFEEPGPPSPSCHLNQQLESSTTDKE